jgi:hypothetical protein
MLPFLIATLDGEGLVPDEPWKLLSEEGFSSQDRGQLVSL